MGLNAARHEASTASTPGNAITRRDWRRPARWLGSRTGAARSWQATSTRPTRRRWCAALLALGLRDAFASAGRGYGYTYGHTLRPRFSFLRIDHILVSPDFAVRDEPASAVTTRPDHRPVIADLAWRGVRAPAAAPRP